MRRSLRFYVGLLSLLSLAGASQAEPAEAQVNAAAKLEARARVLDAQVAIYSAPGLKPLQRSLAIQYAARAQEDREAAAGLRREAARSAETH
jgi:hypothetical protein